MTKLIWSEPFQDLWEVFDDVLGEDATLDRGRRASTSRPLHAQAMWSRSVTIWGGSSPGAAQRHRRARARPAAVGAGMFFALTDDQREFDAAVRGYLAERFDLAAVRAVVEDRDRRRPPGDAVEGRGASRAGWPSPCPRSTTGSGSGWSRPRSSPARSAPGWRRGRGAAPCSPPRRSGWPGRTSSGRPGCPGWPRATRWARSRSRPRARARSPAVEYGAIADVLVGPVGGRPRAGRRARPRTPRGSLRRHRAAGRRARPAPATALPGATAEVVADLAARAAVLVAADLVGIAREALTRTVAYDRERQQFGVPVGSFQAIKHALADLHVRGHPGRARRALRRARRGRRARRRRRWPSSVAKAKAGDAAAGAHRRDDPVPRRHRVHLGARGAPVLQARQAAGRPVGSADAHRARIAELTIG